MNRPFLSVRLLLLCLILACAMPFVSACPGSDDGGDGDGDAGSPVVDGGDNDGDGDAGAPAEDGGDNGDGNGDGGSADSGVPRNDGGFMNDAGESLLNIPICRYMGTRDEGWYQDTPAEERICWVSPEPGCQGATAICEQPESPQEGWYAPMGTEGCPLDDGGSSRLIELADCG